jgi:hypothetical protein
VRRWPEDIARGQGHVQAWRAVLTDSAGQFQRLPGGTHSSFGHSLFNLFRVRLTEYNFLLYYTYNTRRYRMGGSSRAH